MGVVQDLMGREKMLTLATPTGSNNFMDEVMNFLNAQHTAEEILAFQPSDAFMQRSAYLFEHNRNGELTTEEKIELDDILRLNHFVNTLKIRTRQKLGDTYKD